MLTRRSGRVLAVVCLAGLALLAQACEKVPLLAPSGSTITLTASATALSANGSTVIIAQVLESGGTPPHSGTHVTFTTTLGRIEPAEVTTDVGGRATVTFMAGGSNGTATISALSGGATTGSNGAVKIAVGTAAVGRVAVNASPASVPATGGASTITATVLDINGNALVGSPVSFTTTAGTLSATVVTTSDSGTASTVLTTGQQATVTASVGAQAPSSSGGGSGSGSTTTTVPTSSGAASGSVTVNVLNAPTITITPPTTGVTRGLPATFTFTVTAATSNASAVRDVVVNWGDGIVHSIGAFTGAQAQQHTYSQSGTVLISATVTDTAGSSNTVSTSVAVQSPARPAISIVPTPTTAAVNTTMSFAVTITPASGVSIRSASIDYGDGVVDELGASTSTTRTHAFTSAGTKVITVNVLDFAGQTSSGSTNVLITP